MYSGDGALDANSTKPSVSVRRPKATGRDRRAAVMDPGQASASSTDVERSGGDAAAEDGQPAVAGAPRDALEPQRLARRVRRLELQALEQHAQDDVELHVSERGADAAADAAAERDPAVGVGQLVEEALGQEAVRLGEEVGIEVREAGAEADQVARRQLVAADLERPDREAAGEPD